MSIYRERYDMRPIINAAGNYTALGGSISAPEVVEAMSRASADWVSVPDLQRLVAEEIGGLLGFTAGSGSAVQVTAGAGAANMLAAAAAIAGGDRRLMARLPDSSGHRNEIVFPAQLAGTWTKTFEMAGARVVTAPAVPVFDLGLQGRVLASSIDAVAGEIGEKTCAIGAILTWEMPGQMLLSIRALAELAETHGLPLLVDAAAEIPPIGRIAELRSEGATLVSVSGGKALGGPNATGLLVGATAYVRSAGMMAAPAEGMLGRVAKVAREQLVGLQVAAEIYMQQDESAQLAAWSDRCAQIERALSDLTGVRVERVCPDETGLPVPRLRVHLDPGGPAKVDAVTAALRAGEADIRLRGGYPGAPFLNVDVACLRDGEAELVGRRIREEIGSAD